MPSSRLRNLNMDSSLPPKSGSPKPCVVRLSVSGGATKLLRSVMSIVSISSFNFHHVLLCDSNCRKLGADSQEDLILADNLALDCPRALVIPVEVHDF